MVGDYLVHPLVRQPELLSELPQWPSPRVGHANGFVVSGTPLFGLIQSALVSVTQPPQVAHAATGDPGAFARR